MSVFGILTYEIRQKLEGVSDTSGANLRRRVPHLFSPVHCASKSRTDHEHFHCTLTRLSLAAGLQDGLFIIEFALVRSAKVESRWDVNVYQATYSHTESICSNYSPHYTSPAFPMLILQGGGCGLKTDLGIYLLRSKRHVKASAFILSTVARDSAMLRHSTNIRM